MKKFLNLNSRECKSVYPAIKANALKHFSSARLLAAFAEYAPAIGHLILGTEEYLKAFAIFLDSRNFNLRSINGIEKLFHHHGARHNVIKDFFSFYFVIANLFNEFPKTDKSSALKFISLIQTTTDSISFYNWWMKAEELKQRSFYVDFQNKLLSPSDLTKDDYTKALQHAGRVKREISKFIKIVRSIDDEELKKLKQLLLASDFDQLISASIKPK